MGRAAYPFLCKVAAQTHNVKINWPVSRPVLLSSPLPGLILTTRLSINITIIMATFGLSICPETLRKQRPKWDSAGISKTRSITIDILSDRGRTDWAGVSRRQRRYASGWIDFRQWNELRFLFFLATRVRVCVLHVNSKCSIHFDSHCNCALFHVINFDCWPSGGKLPARCSTSSRTKGERAGGRCGLLIRRSARGGDINSA